MTIAHLISINTKLAYPQSCCWAQRIPASHELSDQTAQWSCNSHLAQRYHHVSQTSFHLFGDLECWRLVSIEKHNFRIVLHKLLAIALRPLCCVLQINVTRIFILLLNLQLFFTRSEHACIATSRLFFAIFYLTPYSDWKCQILRNSQMWEKN